MKRIANICDASGNVVGLVHGPDVCDQKITVNGRVWRFDHDERLGPLWLRKNGQERKCQCPGKAVWKEWEKWHKRWRRTQRKSTAAKPISRRRQDGQSPNAPAQPRREGGAA